MDEQIENQDCGADFVDAAVSVARTIDELEEKGEILALAVSIYAECGYTDFALSLAEEIEDVYQRELTLTNLAVTCAAAGDGDQVDSLLEMIEDEVAYGLAIEQVAAAYTRSGEIDKAVETARRLNDSDSALTSIARGCPSRDLLTDCIEIARSIDYPDLKVTALVELAVKARQLEAQSESTELIKEAESAAAELDFPPQRIETRVRIATWYRENNQTEKAAEVLGQARGDCEETDRSGRDAALSQVAAAYAALHDFNSAEQLLEELEDPYEFCRTVAAVALEQYQAGDQNAAIKLLAEGREVIKDEPYGERTLINRQGTLGQLADTYASIERLEDAFQVAELLDSNEQQDEALKWIAYITASAANPGSALKVFERIKDDAARALCEIDVVRRWARNDQLALADHLLGNASADVAKVEWPHLRAKCLAELAQAYELRQQTGRCSESLLESLKTAATIKGNTSQARALIGLAVKHKELNRPASEAELQILEEITAQLD